MLVPWQKVLFSVAGVKKLFGPDSFTGLGMSTIVDLYIFQANPFGFSVLGSENPRSYFPEPNRLQFSITAEVVREICQHIYDSAARLQGYGELVLPSLLTAPFYQSQLVSSPMKSHGCWGVRTFLGDGTQQFSLFGSFQQVVLVLTDASLSTDLGGRIEP